MFGIFIIIKMEIKMGNVFGIFKIIFILSVIILSLIIFSKYYLY
jgi:hypothetical protein